MIKQTLLKTTDNGLIKFTNLDAVAGNVLAEMLCIRHEKMMRTIERIIKQETKRKKDKPTSGLIFSAKFIKWEYKDSMNRTRKTYIMSEDALYLVIANSQSAKAHELKVLFKSEFNLMRMEREARKESIEVHKILSSSIQKLYLGLKKEGSGLPSEAILHIHFTTKIDKILFGEKVSRDMLNVSENQALNYIEQQVSDMILKCLSENMSARNTRKKVYEFIKSYDKAIIKEELQWVA